MWWHAVCPPTYVRTSHVGFCCHRRSGKHLFWNTTLPSVPFSPAWVVGWYLVMGDHGAIIMAVLGGASQSNG